MRAFLSCFSSLALLLVPGCRTGNFPEYSANYREYAYVANSGSNTVSVLDLVHMRPQAVLQVGAHPVALVTSPVRNEVYAVSQGAAGGRGTLAILDAENNRVARTLPLGKAPNALAIDPPGARLYVTNTGSNNVSVVDLKKRQAMGMTGVGEAPDAIAVSPDNTTLVVANGGSGSVSLMDVSESALPRLRASFSGCPGAGSIAVLRDSSKAFIACSGGHQVMVLGLRGSTLGRSRGLGIAEEDRLLAVLDVGRAPVRLVLKPDGGEIFVTNHDSDTISEIATGTNEVGGASLIGSRPSSGVVSADNSLLWVANEGADTVAVYSIDDGKLINTVHVGSGPGPLAFSADEHLLLAADTRSGDISVLRVFSRNFHREPVYGTLFTLLPAGKNPSAIADKAFQVPR
jgi:YVTN family beta-propeller protein